MLMLAEGRVETMKKWVLPILLGAFLATVTAGCKRSEEEEPREAEGPYGSASDVAIMEDRVASGVGAAVPPGDQLTPIQTGAEARDFALKTIDGETFSLASFKGKKVVVLGIGSPYQ